METPLYHIAKLIVPIIMFFLIFYVVCIIRYEPEKKNEYNIIAQQIIRQCIRRYGSFSDSNMPWVTTFVVTHNVNKPSYKNIINIPLKTPDGVIYNKNVVIRQLVHQMAHLYHDSNEHDIVFNKIEHQLLQCSQDLGYYDPNFVKMNIDCNYS